MQAKQTLDDDGVVATWIHALLAGWKCQDADHECSVPGQVLLCGYQPLSISIVYTPLLAFSLDSLL